VVSPQECLAWKAAHCWHGAAKRCNKADRALTQQATSFTSSISSAASSNSNSSCRTLLYVVCTSDLALGTSNGAPPSCTSATAHDGLPQPGRSKQRMDGMFQPWSWTPKLVVSTPSAGTTAFVPLLWLGHNNCYPVASWALMTSAVVTQPFIHSA
jgi:hypothetical protein